MNKRALQALKRTFIFVSGHLHQVLIKRPFYKVSDFYQNMVGKTLDMHKRAFHALKRTFTHVSFFHPAYIDKKKQFRNSLVF